MLGVAHSGTIGLEPAEPDPDRAGTLRRQERRTGLWLLYLVFAVALNFILKYTLPL